jgi:hypothetical protein
VLQAMKKRRGAANPSNHLHQMSTEPNSCTCGSDLSSSNYQIKSPTVPVHQEQVPAQSIMEHVFCILPNSLFDCQIMAASGLQN